MGKTYLAKAYCADIRNLHAEEKERCRFHKQKGKERDDWEKQDGWLPLHDRE